MSYRAIEAFYLVEYAAAPIRKLAGRPGFMGAYVAVAELSSILRSYIRINICEITKKIGINFL
jgi:hypothetical protein